MALREAVLRVCDESGGSVVQHSDGSVHVLNCPHWSARATTMLCCDYPSAVISVRSSVTSLSGFVIVVRERWHVPACAMRRLCIAVLSTLFLFGLIWTLFGMQLDLSMKEAVMNWTQPYIAVPHPNESCAYNVTPVSFKETILKIVSA
jgi:hypothetical protein